MSGYAGVQINGIDTLYEWGLILGADLKIGKPALRKNLIEIPGLDGYIDASNVISDGEPIYGSREITFTLISRDSEYDFTEKAAKLTEYCHGRMCNLCFPNDTEHYYTGLVELGGTEGYRGNKIAVAVTAQPYALKNEPTTVSITIPESGEKTVILYNEMRKATPTFTASGNLTITFNGGKYTLTSGTVTLPGIKLSPGENKITVSGAVGAQLTVVYQEARI